MTDDTPSAPLTDAEIGPLRKWLETEKARQGKYRLLNEPEFPAEVYARHALRALDELVELRAERERKVRDANANPRELLCMGCGEEYPGWSAENDLWNRVCRLPDGSDRWPFLCANCFMRRALEAGAERWFMVVPAVDYDETVCGLRARLAKVERDRDALRAAARARINSGHNDTCGSQLCSGEGVFPCSCGHAELRAALARTEETTQ